MPLVKISIRKGRSQSEKKELLNIVHSSLVEAFKIPDEDRIQRIYEYDDDEFEIRDVKHFGFEEYELTKILRGSGLKDSRREQYYVIKKPDKAGRIRGYPLFFMYAMKA